MQCKRHAVRHGRSVVGAFWLVWAILGSLSWLGAQVVKKDKLLFVSGRAGGRVLNIYTMSPEGSKRTALTNTTGIELDPVWSPDGKQIAFTVVTNPNDVRSLRKGDICVCNADGSQRQHLTQNPPGTTAIAPTWSRDGKRLAYCTFELAGNQATNPQLHVMDANGQNRKPLGKGLVPAWSPDGKKILFTLLTRQNSGATFRLSVMNPDGSHVKPLLNTGTSAMGAWSPDGKRIAYVALGSSGKWNLCVVNADDSQPRQLTRINVDECCPQWSADGKRIFFSRHLNSGGELVQNWEIFAMDADGRNVQQLTNNPAIDALGSGFMLTMVSFARPMVWPRYPGSQRPPGATR